MGGSAPEPVDWGTAEQPMAVNITESLAAQLAADLRTLNFYLSRNAALTFPVVESEFYLNRNQAEFQRG